MLDVSGTMREFLVSVPAGYSPSKPTRVVFAWHALGGTARQIVGNIFGGPYYGLKSKLTDAIFISAQGLADTSGANMGMTGWQNSNGRDVAFARALLAWLDMPHDWFTTEAESTAAVELDRDAERARDLVPH